MGIREGAPLRGGVLPRGKDAAPLSLMMTGEARGRRKPKPHLAPDSI